MGTLARLAMMLDPAIVMAATGLEPDPWQAELLRCTDDRILMLCARQSGKSSVSAPLALATAMGEDDALVLLISPSLRQSGELFIKVTDAYRALGRPLGAVQDSATTLALGNGSRIVSLPNSPATVRGFSGPRLIIADEAALIDDDTFTAILPMLATSAGRLVCPSTPCGKRGMFFDWWANGGPGWRRFRVTAEDCPRIPRAFLAEQRVILGERGYSQEMMCEFVDAAGQVFATEHVEAAFTSAESPLFPERESREY